jgi:oligopeptide transport system substrate-binding protein
VSLILLLAFFSQEVRHSNSNQTQAITIQLSAEPSSLDPSLSRTLQGSWVLQQLYLPLLRFADGKLVGEAAKDCFAKGKKVFCELKPNLKTSAGEALTAYTYENSIKAFMRPESKSFRADLLFAVLNAKEIFAGSKAVDELGVKAINESLLEFTLYDVDSEFLYNLTSPLFSPGPPLIQGYSGPFALKNWSRGESLALSRNPFYQFIKQKDQASPVQEILFLVLPEDNIALNLYEKGTLNFLRRLPSVYIPKFKNRKDYHEIDLWRFDYLGLTNNLKSQEHLRKALIESIDYNAFQDLVSAKPRPGCPGVPALWTQTAICVHTQNQDTDALSSSQNLPQLTLGYSKLGGDDIERAMEWLSIQWKTLGVAQVTLKAYENKTFSTLLAKAPPDLFRRGIPIERPTCLSALEFFQSKAKDNFIKFSNSRFDELLLALRKTSIDAERTQLCREAMSLLIESKSLIPLGPIFFALLVDPKLVGWQQNELGSLWLGSLAKTH